MTTIAVTGSEGFIASHLVETLVREGYHVRAMVQYNSFSSFGWLETVGTEMLDHVDIRLGDVRDHRSVDELADGADAICHLAALIAIPYSYQAPELVPRDQRGRHAERARSRPSPRHATRDPHVDERGLRHGDDACRSPRITGCRDSRRTRRRRSPPTSSPRAITSASTFRSRPFGRSTRTDRDSRREPSSRRRSARSPPASARSARVALDPTRDFNFVSDTVAAFLSLVEADDDVLGTHVQLRFGQRDLDRRPRPADRRGHGPRGDGRPSIRNASARRVPKSCASSATTPRCKAATSWKPAYTLEARPRGRRPSGSAIPRTSLATKSTNTTSDHDSPSTCHRTPTARTCSHGETSMTDLRENPIHSSFETAVVQPTAGARGGDPGRRQGRAPAAVHHADPQAARTDR